MSKKISIQLTLAQARAVAWAIDTFENSYVDYGDADADRAVRMLEANIVPQLWDGIDGATTKGE